jgi:phosphoglycolate phosphatase
MSAFDHVCFDLDGTLVDSYRDIASALNFVLRTLGLPERSPEEIKTMIGAGVGELLARGLADRDPSLLEKARALFKDAYFERVVETTRPYDGVLSLISLLNAAGVTTTIATNKPSLFTSVVVSRLGLLDAGIRACASADEAGVRKPDSRVLELAIERTGVPLASVRKDRVLYVGDMPIDVASARAFGCPIAIVGWGFDPAGAREAAPDHFVSRVEELVTLTSA